MASITTRAGKGSPLTHAEVDANFNNLNNDKLDIGSAPANSITVASSGRVGIGTGSPQARLEVHAPGTSRSYTSSVLDFSNIHLNGITPSAATSALTFASGGGGGAAVAFSRGGSVDTEISFWTNSVGGANAATQRMIIDAAGRVGIGISSPSGGLQLHNPTAGSAADFVISNPANNWSIKTGTTTNALSVVDNQYSAERLRIDSSGGVGIGITSPPSTPTGASLDVNGPLLARSWLNFHQTNAGVLQYSLNETTLRSYGSVAGSGYIAFRTGGGGGSTDYERVRIDAAGRLLVGTSTARTSSVVEMVYGDANTNADYSGAAASFVAPGLVATGANPATISVEDNRAMAINVGGSIGFGGRYLSADSKYAQWAAIAGKKETGTSAEYGGYLGFYTRTHGTNAIDERMRIDSSGDVLVGTTTVRARLTLEKAFAGGTAIDTNTTTASTTYSAAAFRHNGTLVGQITASTTATAYVTSSDYRLKENIEPVAGGITRLKQLNPSRFNFITDPDRTVDGFIAHEVQAVVPEAITGEKDAEDDDGNPIYQGIDQSKLVPLLTAALQEAIAKIETLEAKVAALEAG